jgi:hypothetical protein
VNRTDLDALGIKYDLGTRQQFFNQVIQRTDSSGKPGSPQDPPTVLLGGNTVSAIANASGNVPVRRSASSIPRRSAGSTSRPSSTRSRKSRSSTCRPSRA